MKELQLGCLRGVDTYYGVLVLCCYYVGTMLVLCCYYVVTMSVLCRYFMSALLCSCDQPEDPLLLPDVVLIEV